MHRMALGSLLVSISVCNRTPEEPQRPSAVTIATPSAAVDPHPAPRNDHRCLRATPDAPPPVAPPAQRCPVDPAGGPPAAAATTLHFTEASGSPGLEVELAKTPEQSARGLMYRTHMASDHGMLFALGTRDDHAFWMHNTCISLDMMFVDDDGTIVGLLENVPTLDDHPRSVGCASRYVIETNAGWCRQHGVSAGQRVELPRL